ncbi:MAG: hypothetical protein E6F98_12905 [Actinobacteria bacterium]|nr:MAG: hypothetical protein E6F98_12905 [Actinomycetota bacterium]
MCESPRRPYVWLWPAFVAVLSVLALGLPGASAAGPSTATFAAPVYVDQTLAGGEPTIFADTLHGRLIYTSHEGTTHLYRDGLVASPWGDFNFVANYCNQVNTWTSPDGGVNWYRDRYLGSPCPTSPTNNEGFSDPDLTQDAGGRVYNTGINLVNDSLFSSIDGGQTWDKGTADCHDGDRPWLAGAKANQVFMGTDTLEGSGSGHQVFISNDGGQTCTATGIDDNGSLTDGGTWTAFGKLYYDRLAATVVEPAIFQHGDGSFGVGISTMPNGGSAFTPHEGYRGTSMYAHWPAIAIDAAGTVYVVWDTNDRQAGTSGGCSGAATPAPNSIMMVSTKDLGKTWSSPVTVAHPGTRVLWPWIAAGDAGNVSVIWYQTEPQDGLPDLDCQSGHIHVMEDSITNASGKNPSGAIVDAAGRYVHNGWVCQGGTTCVATGQDRRLGDYFTNGLDARGCVLIATGDTRLTDPTTGSPLPTARPLFIRQNGGPRLIGHGTCS